MRYIQPTTEVAILKRLETPIALTHKSWNYLLPCDFSCFLLSGKACLKLWVDDWSSSRKKVSANSNLIQNIQKTLESKNSRYTEKYLNT